MRRILFLALALTGCAQKTIRPANGEMTRLLKAADTDHDQKITVLDRPTEFKLRCHCGTDLDVAGTYPLSNLLQELKLAEIENRREITVARIFENPVDRISRSIRERYWNNLTRRVDLANLAQVLEDPKLPKQEWRYLYVSGQDPKALEYFRAAPPSLKVKVEELPADMRSLKGKHGLLALALEQKNGVLRGAPFVVPGGRFNEMYGWDSYFEALGLAVDGRAELIRAMGDNFIYQIEHYGKILNANRSYYLNRSQPPFLTSMILLIQDKEWRKRATQAAIKEYFEVWQSPARQTDTGLNRYFGSDYGIPPEVEPGHFDHVIKERALARGMTTKNFRSAFDAGKLKDDKFAEFLAHDRAVRESGHDTTSRWLVDGQERAADFVTVDLNSLLFKYEKDLALLTGDPAWHARADKRKDLMMKYMWDEDARCSSITIGA